jgi:hypothetical protein
MIINAAILKEGVIYQGRRHYLIIREGIKLGKKFFIGCPQGFIDDEGNFLNREQAAKHAIQCGQIKELKFSKTELFSEELW